MLLPDLARSIGHAERRRNGVLAHGLCRSGAGGGDKTQAVKCGGGGARPFGKLIGARCVAQAESRRDRSRRRVCRPVPHRRHPAVILTVLPASPWAGASEAPQEPESYAAIGARLGMSEGAVKLAAFRLRQRYRELIREEVGQTVDSEAELEAEMRWLFEVLSTGAGG